MHEWCAPPASYDINTKTTRRQRRDRPARSVLVTSVLLLFLGGSAVKVMLVCTMGTVDESSPRVNRTKVMSIASRPGLVLPPNVTNFTEDQVVALKHTRDISTVPLHESNGYKDDTLDMHSSLRKDRMKSNARNDNKIPRITQQKVYHRIFKRKRRAAVVSNILNTTAPSEILQTNDTDNVLTTSSYVTTVPIGTSQIVSSTVTQQSPTLGLSNHEVSSVSHHQPSSYPSQQTNPSPTSLITEPLQTMTAFPMATTPTRLTASNPPTETLEPTGDPVSSTRYDLQTTEPKGEFPSTLEHFNRASTEMLDIQPTPTGLVDAETPNVFQASSTATSDVILENTVMLTTRMSESSSSSRVPESPSKANSASLVESDVPSQKHTYISLATIETSPSILVVMPICVALALAGLMGAGVKRCLLYRRLRRAMELERGSQLLKEDKGYTIENPMPKSRRSYIARQVAKTLHQVNKSESSKNILNSTAEDTQVRMEIATISGGSLGVAPESPSAPVGSLRRTASERTAPSRRHSSLKDCKCCCHCPLCGYRETLNLKNGNSTTGSATTRL